MNNLKATHESNIFGIPSILSCKCCIMFVVQGMIQADVNQMSHSFTSLEGKYINVYKKLLQVEKCTACSQTPGH